MVAGIRERIHGLFDMPSRTARIIKSVDATIHIKNLRRLEFVPYMLGTWVFLSIRFMAHDGRANLGKVLVGGRHCSFDLRET